MYTHFLTGILIQKLVFRYLPPSPLSWILIIALCFLSHWLVDPFSYVTFHPDEHYLIKYPNDKFHTIHQTTAGFLAAVVVLIFTFVTPGKFEWFKSFISPNNYFFAMLAAWFVDFIDWVVIRGLINKGILPQKMYSAAIFHATINKFRESIFPWMPNWREKKWGALIDIGITSILLILVLII